MSKRPSTAGAVLSRLRRPFGRLRDLPIWSKLGLIMIVPTIATIVVGTNGLISHIGESKDADRARTLANISEDSGALVHGLQNERAGAVQLLGASSNDKQNQLSAFREAEGPVDSATRPYTQHSAVITDLPANFAKVLTDIGGNLGELKSIRSQIEGAKISITDATNWYQVLINGLITIRESSAQLAGDAGLGDQMRAAAAVAREKEFLSLERTVVLKAFSLDSITQGLKQAFIGALAGQDLAVQNFRTVATNSEREFYDQTVSGSALREAKTYEGFIESLSGTSLSGATFKASDWDAAMVGQAELLRTVEVSLDKEMVANATSLRDAVTRRVLIETGVLLGMLLLAILFAWLVARSMARSLRELRHGALSVAQYGLPQAVARLRDPALSTQLSPTQVAAQIAEPLPVRTKDEFGQVTEAFNAVHLEAVRTAAEQAALRSSVATMFVNLARRSQILVDRLIGHLDRLERGEEDPDHLAELFQLDHLATRMRRNDENLLVLAGADSTRVQREPAALLDVLRAAQSEVEHYTRIEFGVIDRDIEVAAHAVNDLVHLLAELFDNATAFSPPDSHVVVEARRVGDRAALYVEDRGIGISPEQLADLNERLATPPMVDVAVSRMMGLVVVARLAARHGVKVELRRAAERGTVADVMMPTSVLVPRALVGRVQASRESAAGFGAPQSGPAPSQRSPFGAPLALESGPSGPSGWGEQRGFGDAFADEAGPPSQAGTRPGLLDSSPAAGDGRLLGPAASSRAMPPWSDLTGASNANGSSSTGGFGHNGGFGSNGAPSNGTSVGPGPGGFGGVSGPHGGSGFPSSLGSLGNGDEPFTPRTPDSTDSDPLPQRRATDPWTVDGEVAGDGPTPMIPRQMPVTPETPSGLLGGQGRRPSDFMAPTPFQAFPPVPPVSAPPPTARPTAAPVSATPASPPPAWPPVAPGARPAGEPEADQPGNADADAGATPAVPEELAAALDMTAEIPKLRTDTTEDAGPRSEVESAARADSPSARPGAVPLPRRPTPPASVVQRPVVEPRMQQRARLADETMELPIFRELESAWFRTARPPVSAPEPAAPTASSPSPSTTSPSTTSPTASVATPVSSPPVTAAPTPAPPVVQPRPAAAPSEAAAVPASRSVTSGPALSGANGTTTGNNTTMAGTLMPADAAGGAGQAGGAAAGGSSPWQTAADSGWQAATAAAEAKPIEKTDAGLPKRVPMAQLVPGGVERATNSAQRRTPEAVRGLLSAYHRGVQRGRTQPQDDESINPEPTSAGPQSEQGGKEQEA